MRPFPAPPSPPCSRPRRLIFHAPAHGTPGPHPANFVNSFPAAFIASLAARAAGAHAATPGPLPAAIARTISHAYSYATRLRLSAGRGVYPASMSQVTAMLPPGMGDGGREGHAPHPSIRCVIGLRSTHHRRRRHSQPALRAGPGHPLLLLSAPRTQSLPACLPLRQHLHQQVPHVQRIEQGRLLAVIRLGALPAVSRQVDVLKIAVVRPPPQLQP